MFLGLNLDEAQELSTVVGGEYQLQVSSIEKRDAADSMKRDFFLIKFKILDQSDPTKAVTRCLFLPKPDDDADKKLSMINQMSYFAEAFGFSFSEEVAMEDIIGSTGWALLKEKSSADYGDQNEVTRFIRPAA